MTDNILKHGIIDFGQAGLKRASLEGSDYRPLPIKGEAFKRKEYVVNLRIIIFALLLVLLSFIGGILFGVIQCEVHDNSDQSTSIVIFGHEFKHN